MSTSAEQDHSGDSPSEPETPEAEEAPESAAVETTECSNCGRAFVGNYCPECGQEADASLSPFDVVSGFFRELVDFERGFWPTFKGLLFRPRTTLKEYVDGARRKFAHPGRYLMSVIVLVYLGERLAVWSGVRDLYPASYIWGEMGPIQTIGDLLANWPRIWMLPRETFYNSQEFLIVAYLLLALLVSLMLFQLLRERLGLGEALAMGAFVSGQLVLFVAVNAWIFDALTLLIYLSFEYLLIPNFGISHSGVGFNIFPFTFYLGLNFFYVTYITIRKTDLTAEEGDFLYSIQLFDTPPIFWVKEKEPMYFFGPGMAWGLHFCIFQYIAMIGPVGLIFKDQVFSAGIAQFIGILFLPNLAIEVYQQLR